MGSCLVAQGFPSRGGRPAKDDPGPRVPTLGVGRDGDVRQGSGGTDTSPGVVHELSPLFTGSDGTEAL